jgi:hypothetical protein
VQRCVIEDLDLSGAKHITSALLSNVTFTRVVFKGAALLVCLCRCCMRALFCCSWLLRLAVNRPLS